VGDRHWVSCFWATGQTVGAPDGEAAS